MRNSETNPAILKAFVNEYLTRWDEFARGRNEYLPPDQYLFEEKLAYLCDQGDPSAPARIVFYVVVQVGGSIAAESELGYALKRVSKGTIKTCQHQKKKVYAAPDIFSWWEKNKRRFKPFSLLSRWRKRDFAKTQVIPMYKAMAARSK